MDDPAGAPALRSPAEMALSTSPRPIHFHAHSRHGQVEHGDDAPCEHDTGVGISPQLTSEAKEMPDVGFGHMRRGSERCVGLCCARGIITCFSY
jgi:hypothetical protein